MTYYRHVTVCCLTSSLRAGCKQRNVVYPELGRVGTGRSCWSPADLEQLTGLVRFWNCPVRRVLLGHVGFFERNLKTDRLQSELTRFGTPSSSSSKPSRNLGSNSGSCFPSEPGEFCFPLSNGQDVLVLFPDPVRFIIKLQVRFRLQAVLTR